MQALVHVHQDSGSLLQNKTATSDQNLLHLCEDHPNGLSQSDTLAEISLSLTITSCPSAEATPVVKADS